jgi:subtilisin family serine protease
MFGQSEGRDGARRRRNSHRAWAVLTGSVVALTAGAALATAAPPNNDPTREGPPDGPRGKNQRQAATNNTSTLADYWAESPRHEGPNKGEIIPGSWIVVFKPGTANGKDLARDLTNNSGGNLKHVYESALQGFAATNISDDKAARLADHPNVLSIERDRVAGAEDTQSPVTWGLDRIDQRDLPLSNSYTDGTEGAGVHAYIIDTGIRRTHAEFTGRMGNGYDAVTAGGTANDCHGHGTHVAGTVGGTTYGVADKAILHAVRVLDCNGSGSNSGVIAGVDWVKINAIKPAVANMSLGGGASSALDTAVTNSIAAGISFAVAAGNSNANACNYSPARTANAITVGSTTNTDNRSSFSNWGTCLDIFAPGSTITAAWSTSDTATNTISGTSMASPHVAGAAALYLSANKTATPQVVRDTLVNSATLNKVISAGTGSPNRLLFTGSGGQTPPPPPPPPPPPGSNVIVNPGFENGTTGWIQTSSGGYPLISSSKPRTGSFGAWLTGYNSATETIGQTVTVASGSSTLRYWWHMTSSESTATAYDYLRVRIYNAATGALIATPRTWSNTSVRNVWSQDTLSLAAYVGQSIRIVFEGVTDSSVVSSFYIDDVSLGA